MNMPFFTDEKGNVYYPNGGLPPMWQQHGSNSSIPPLPGWQMHGHGGGNPLSPAPGSVAAPLSGEMGGGPYSSGPYGPPLPPPSPNVALGFSQSSFSYEELAAATAGFSSANLLGQGGFGYVYKGVLAGSGKEVAVKQLKSGSGQGEREFQAEVEIISRVHHRHLDSLVDWARPLLGRALAGETGFAELVDLRLGGDYSPVEVERMAACAAASIRHSARRRPKMSKIVRALEGDALLEDLHEGGVKPGQSALFSGSSSASDISRLRQLAFDSGDYSDYGDSSVRPPTHTAANR
ncbi:hypothetical protein ABZP36_029881 [Zizania latifolia]